MHEIVRAIPEPVGTIAKLLDSHGVIVSHETNEKLEIYYRLLLKWQNAINLVGPSTLDNIPLRHFHDSAQMMKFIPNPDVTLADMGSGAGFPGLVLAIMGVRNVHLIESDVRKATFLREVSRETKTPVTIHDKRIEDCTIQGIDVFTARALAPLEDLLKHVVRLMDKSSAYCLFLKGAQHEDEIAKAHKKWNFATEINQSQTDPTGKIIKISALISKHCGT